MEKVDSRSFGRVIMDVGKYLRGRSCKSSAVLQNSKGEKAHVWSVVDGETIVIVQDTQAGKNVMKNAQVLTEGSSSWINFQATSDKAEEVLNHLKARGFNLESMMDIGTRNKQLSLLESRGA